MARAFLVVYLFFTSSLLIAQDVELFLNANDYPRTGVNSNSAVFDGKLFFAYETKEYGRELWILEGPGATPRLFMDIEPGADSSSPESFVVANNLLFFSAATSDHGDELWKSDGTVAGTELVKDLNPGPLSSFPTELVRFNTDRAIAFSALSATEGREFCVSEGTSATTRCFDINPGAADSRPRLLTAIAGAVAFSANDGVKGSELWAILYINSSSVPYNVADINPGASGSGLASLYAMNSSSLLFAANDGTNGFELWISNGSTPGTYMVADLEPGASGSYPGRFVTRAPGQVLFAAQTAAEGSEIWSTDGVTASRLKDINPGSASSDPQNLFAFNGEVFFAAKDGTHGLELWKSDGTPSGTVLLKDIWTGAEDSRAEALFATASELYFKAKTPEFGTELYVSDGTPSGTSLLSDLRTGSASSNVGEFVDAGSHIYFFGAGDESPGVFALDSASGTIDSFAPLPGIGDGYSSVKSIKAFDNDRLFLSLKEDNYGFEPYVLDIESREATLLADLVPGEDSSGPTYIGLLDGKIVFSAYAKDVGREFWISDGTPSGTELLADIFAGVESSAPSGFNDGLVFKNELYFLARDAAHGSEIWKTDGTPAGTMMLRDINPGPANSDVNTIYEAFGKLFFGATEPVRGFELWTSDGTEAGTELFKDMNPGAGDGYFYSPYLHDGTLFFSGEDGVNGREVWKSDGTASGTVRISNIAPGAADAYPSGFTARGDTILFGAKGAPGVGPALYAIDPPYTLATVRLVTDSDPASIAGGVSTIKDIYGTTLFVPPSTTYGYELWTTDGTNAGTELFKDINPGNSPAEIGSFIEAGDYFYFGADDGVAGNELWRTDGTEAGTELFTDIAPGAYESYPQFEIVHRGALYFKATTEEFGDELWRLVFDACPDDSSKNDPGICGCGVADTDSDGDGAADCQDACDTDPAKTAAGACGCGVSDADSDADGTPDCVDACSADAAKIAAGTCGCGVSDADANSNGIIDCLFTAEFRALVVSLQQKVKKLKKAGGNKKKKKRARLARKEARAAIAALTNYFQVNNLGIQSAGETDLSRLLKKAQRKSRKALKIKSSKFKKNKRKARRQLAKLLSGIGT